MENTNVNKIWEDSNKIIEFKKENKLPLEEFEIEMANKCDYLFITTIKDKKVSEHDASVKVGQLLVDEYVIPRLD